MITVIGHTKGGVGKSTLAVAIATQLALLGRRVWLIDTEPLQKSSMLAITARAEAGVEPMLAVSNYADGVTLRSQVKVQAGNYDEIVIDGSAKDSSTLRAALVLAHKLVTPFGPRNFELWSLKDVVPLVEEAHGMRDGLDVIGVLNRADPQGRDNADALEYARTEAPAFRLLPASLVRRDAEDRLGQLNALAIGTRKAVPDASSIGLSVHEYGAADPKAKAEIDGLMAGLYGDWARLVP